MENNRFDSLFNTLFIVISITIVPFIATLMQSQTMAYKSWAALSFVSPIMLTILIWGVAVFRDSVLLRVAGWGALAFQIARVPFVLLVEIVGISYAANVFWGSTPLYPIVEFTVAATFGELIAKKYSEMVEAKKTMLLYSIPVLATAPLSALSYLGAVIAVKISSSTIPSTVTTTGSASTTTPIVVPIIPGFSAESIILGLILGLAILLLPKRNRKRDVKPSRSLSE